MQMLTSGSEEGGLPGLGLIQAHTKRFAARPGLRIPHMGWDAVRWTHLQHPLARGLGENSRFYFVHSYCVSGVPAGNALALCNYGKRFAAAIMRDNIAVQFHPGKSPFRPQLLNNSPHMNSLRPCNPCLQFSGGELPQDAALRNPAPGRPHQHGQALNDAVR
jgi:glutamine amidotransferase